MQAYHRKALWPRTKCTNRLLYTLVIFVCLTLSNLFGIIQFRSNQVIIHLYPVHLSNNILLPSESELTKDEFKDDYKLVVANRNSRKDQIDQKSMRQNISRLFVSVSKSKAEIKADLSEMEITAMLRLEARNKEVVNQLQNIQREEFLPANTSNGTYDNYIWTSKLDYENFIERSDLVKLLKLEKFKKTNKELINVKMQMDRMNQTGFLKNETELEKYWNNYFYKINELRLYNDPVVLSEMLEMMATTEIASTREAGLGSQIKLIIELKNGIKAMAKFMRVPRTYITPPDILFFTDIERHIAEIASFHVDKLLNFYRSPPTVGRVLDLTRDIRKKADASLATTFFKSPVGNTCLTGRCDHYCDTGHAICGKPGNRIEVSMQLLLPRAPLVKWVSTVHPYRRSYNKKKKADWEFNENYCLEEVFQDVTLMNKVMLDLIDLSIFDFITGNMDRHHYEQMIANTSFPIHLDNGRAFGKTQHDEMSILKPLTQCCLVRYSTLNRLKYLYQQGFSSLLDASTKADPLYPLLTNDHLKAVDRRLLIILNEISNCALINSVNQVVIDDGY